MGPVRRRFFPLAAVQRTFQAAGSPARWRRGVARHMDPAHHLYRIAAWLGRWRGDRPRLRRMVLWGEGLARAVDSPPAAEAGKPPRVPSRRPASPIPTENPVRGPEGAGDRPKRAAVAAPEPAGAERRRETRSPTPSETAGRAAALSPEAGPALLRRLAAGETRSETPSPPGNRHTTRPAEPASRRPKPAARYAGWTAQQSTEPRPAGSGLPGTAEAAPDRVDAWRHRVEERIRHRLLRSGEGTAVRLREAVDPTPGNGPHPTGSAGGGTGGPSVEAATSGTVPSPWRQPLEGRRAAIGTLAAAAGGSATGSAGPPPAGSPTRRSMDPGTAERRNAPEPRPKAATSGASGPWEPRSSAAPPAREEAAGPVRDRPLDALLRHALSEEDRVYPTVNPPESAAPTVPPVPPHQGKEPTRESLDSGETAAAPHREDRHPPLPPPGPAAIDDDADLDRLTDRIGQILMEEARRHGIDV